MPEVATLLFALVVLPPPTCARGLMTDDVTRPADSVPPVVQVYVRVYQYILVRTCTLQ